MTCANWVKKYDLRFSDEPDVEAYDMLGSRTRPTAQTTGEAVDVIVPKLVAKAFTMKGALIIRRVRNTRLLETDQSMFDSLVYGRS